MGRVPKQKTFEINWSKLLQARYHSTGELTPTKENHLLGLIFSITTNRVLRKGPLHLLSQLYNALSPKKTEEKEHQTYTSEHSSDLLVCECDGGSVLDAASELSRDRRDL